MSEMEILAIGQRLPFSWGALREGCHYTYDATGHWLHYLYRSPTGSEIRSLQTGEARFGLFIHGPVLFLLHQFHGMLWNDSSFSWWLVSEDARQVPLLGDGLHAILKAVMVDTANGIVVALRALTFSPEFTGEELFE